MTKKSEDFLALEKYFGFIKNKENIDDNLRRIEIILKRTFDIEFKLNITDNTTNRFFGMNIYPDISSMDMLIDNIVNKKKDTETIVKLWQNTTSWYIDIDSILLYDSSLNANPAEIVAVLLHEIGHIVYSNTVPQKLNKILRFKIAKIKYVTRELITDEKIRKIFNLTVVETCSSKNYTHTDIRKERIADKFAIKYGYGSNLDEFIDKLIRSQGNSLVNRSEKEMDNDITAIVNWSINNIEELQMRKNKLQNALKIEMLKTPSVIVKNIVKDIYSKFFGNQTEERYREILSEQYCGTPDNTKYVEALSEQKLFDYIQYKTDCIIEEGAKKFFGLGSVKKVDQVELDILEVEVDKIETADDKIYLLDRVSFESEKINAALMELEKGNTHKVKQSKTKLLQMEDQIERIRDKILNTKIIDKTYGVFIKYPKGYQG